MAQLRDLMLDKKIWLAVSVGLLEDLKKMWKKYINKSSAKDVSSEQHCIVTDIKREWMYMELKATNSWSREYENQK